MLSTVLLAGYWPCPKELQRFTFVSPAHSPHYPPTPDVNSSTLTAGFLCVLFCTQIFEKNDCSRRMRKVVFKHATLAILLKNPCQESFSSLFLVKNCSAISTREISDENDCSRENDCVSWDRSLIEMCERTMQCHFTGGSLIIVIFLGQTCAQTWPMRMVSDLTCTFPVRMCNHSLEVMLNYQRAMSRP